MSGFTLGYNGVPWARSWSPQDRFYVDAGQVLRPLLPFGEEMMLAAREIGEAFHGEEIHVFYGGGIDSEAVLEAFRRAKVPVKAVVVRATGGENAEELKHVTDYCARTGFDNVDLLDFDYAAWCKSRECADLMSAAQTPYSIVTWFHPAALERYTGKVMTTGYGETLTSVSEGRWCFTELEATSYAQWKIFQHLKIQGPPCFYLWNVYLNMAWLTSPFWDIIHRKFPRHKDSEPFKAHFFHQELGLPVREKAHTRCITDRNSIWNRYFRMPIAQWVGERLAALELQAIA